jgi:hypothetical protein
MILTDCSQKVYIVAARGCMCSERNYSWVARFSFLPYSWAQSKANDISLHRAHKRNNGPSNWLSHSLFLCSLLAIREIFQDRSDYVRNDDNFAFLVLLLRSSSVRISYTSRRGPVFCQHQARILIVLRRLVFSSLSLADLKLH